MPDSAAHRRRFHDDSPRRQYLRVTVDAYFLDASVLIKYFIDEDRSDIVRTFVGDCLKARREYEIVFRTTNLCLGETLGKFKAFRAYERLSLEQYQEVVKQCVFVIQAVVNVEEPPLHIVPFVLDAVMQFVEKHELDVGDAFLLHAVRSYQQEHSRLAGEVRVCLVTADRKLARAARAEGVLAWEVMSEASPELMPIGLKR